VAEGFGMTRPLGKRQLELLLFAGTPARILLAPDRVARSLAQRGLMEPVRKSSKALRISADGLRALADAHEAKQLDQLMKLPARREGDA